MTRKDFELIAEVLREDKPVDESMDAGSVWVDTCERFADRLRLVNPRFCRGRFLKACGLDE